MKNSSRVQIACRIRKPTTATPFSSTLPRTRQGSNSPFKPSVKRSSVSPGARSPSSGSSTKHCIFTTKQPSRVVLATPVPVTSKVLASSLVDEQDLEYFQSTILQENALQFSFDKVFNAERHKTEALYSSCLKRPVQSMFKGESACVLLFGTSLSGKTYTLKGTKSEKGLLVRAAEELFNIIQARSDAAQEGRTASAERSSFIVRASAFQIHCHRFVDLLNSAGTPHASSSKRIRLEHFLDDSREDVVSKLKNVTERVVPSIDDFHTVLREIFKSRKYEAHRKDRKSHTAVSLSLEKRCARSKYEQLSLVTFCELAGSEQAVSHADSRERVLLRAHESCSVDGGQQRRSCSRGRNCGNFTVDVSRGGGGVGEVDEERATSFVTNSFNLISASLLKCALRKRIKGQERGEQGEAAKLVSALSRSLNRRANVLLVCCVASGADQYEHSVPAL